MSEDVWLPASSNQADVESRVLRVVRSVIGINDLSIEASLNPAIDLGSMEDVELIIGLEEEFGIAIPNADAEQFFLEHRPTMRDFVELVNRYVH